VGSNWEVDRSRVLDFQSCPRRRYFGFHFNGTGIQRKSKSLPLVFGGAFHEGVEILLQAFAWIAQGDTIELAVGRAKQFIDQSFLSLGVDLGEGEKTSLYALAEQKAIAEGLLRGWWAYEGERFLTDFEVLEVEQEGRAEMGDGITLLFRPDAVVRERATGDVYVISWKTESSHGQWSMNRAGSDMQSMSEVWGVQNEGRHRFVRDGGAYGNSVDAGSPNSGADSVEGVLYKFAVKGSRRMDDFLGFKVQDTPLAYGWRRFVDGVEEWAWKYRWPSEEEGRKMEQLPKGFQKVPIWEKFPGGVKAWVEGLASQTIRPYHLNALEGVFPQSLPVSRRGDEIESWRRQIVGQEGRVRQRARAVELDRTEEVLDREFPQHTARCFDYNSRCGFYDACFTPAVHADPLGSGLYQIRVSNHPEKGEEE
jgi:hypothetical protein